MSKYCDCNQGRLPCSCKINPPPAPSMREPAREPFASSAVLIIVFALAIGVMAGWQMHGGVCVG
jgi:hypothetical protein